MARNTESDTADIPNLFPSSIPATVLEVRQWVDQASRHLTHLQETNRKLPSDKLRLLWRLLVQLASPILQEHKHVRFHYDDQHFETCEDENSLLLQIRTMLEDVKRLDPSSKVNLMMNEVDPPVDLGDATKDQGLESIWQSPAINHANDTASQTHRLRQIPKEVLEELSKIDVSPPPGLDPVLADVYHKVALGIKACTRLKLLTPYIWHNVPAYKQLATSVSNAVAAAREAHTPVKIRVARQGGPNPIQDVLRALQRVQDHVPVEPSSTDGGAEGRLIRFWINRNELFRPFDNCLERIIEQLANVPPEPVAIPPAADSHEARRSLPEDEEGDGKRIKGVPLDEAKFVLARDGDVWFVRAFGKEGRFTDLRGFQVLDKLLRSPGKPVPMLELLADNADSFIGNASKEGALDAGLSIGQSKPQSILDPEAKADIKANIQRLKNEINEADNDVDREDSQAKLKVLLARYEPLLGKNGKPRDLSSLADSMRARIWKQLHKLLAKFRVAEYGMGELAKHLKSPTIRAIGSDFIYSPPPEIVWSFSQEIAP